MVTYVVIPGSPSFAVVNLQVTSASSLEDFKEFFDSITYRYSDFVIVGDLNRELTEKDNPCDIKDIDDENDLIEYLKPAQCKIITAPEDTSILVTNPIIPTKKNAGAIYRLFEV